MAETEIRGPALPCHVSTQLDLIKMAKVNAVARASGQSASQVMGEAIGAGLDNLLKQWSVTYEDIDRELDRVVIAKRHASRSVELRAQARDKLRRSYARRLRAARGAA